MPQRGRNSQKSRKKESAEPSMTDEEARRALESSDKRYYRIGEVSKLTGVKAHVLRYWETEFRWMAPPKSRSKQRLYRKRDIEFVWLLKRLLWDERYTIAGARQRIQELGVDGALALLDEPANPTPTTAARATPEAATATATDRVLVSTEWAGFRAALGEMHAELTSLRGLLQEGA